MVLFHFLFLSLPTLFVSLRTEKHIYPNSQASASKQFSLVEANESPSRHSFSTTEPAHSPFSGSGEAPPEPAHSPFSGSGEASPEPTHSPFSGSGEAPPEPAGPLHLRSAVASAGLPSPSRVSEGPAVFRNKIEALPLAQGTQTGLPSTGVAKAPNRVKEFKVTDFSEKLPIALEEGGMSTVAVYRERASGKKFVIKQAKKGMHEYLDKEYKIMKLITGMHPNIIRLEGVVKERARLQALVIEYADGKDLIDAKIPKHEFQRFIFEICRGVAFLHENGTSHRDLKLENIIADTSNGKLTPKIIDFGIAEASRTLHKLAGTFEYTAPEFFLSSGPFDGFKADVYATGLLIFGMMYRRRIYARDVALKEAIVNQKFNLPQHLSKNYYLKDFLLSMLEKDPETRPEMKDLLDHPIFTGL